VWAWDLSTTLGWAREGSGATPPGAWLEHAAEPWRARGARRGAAPVPAATFPAPCPRQHRVQAPRAPQLWHLFPDAPGLDFACLSGFQSLAAGSPPDWGIALARLLPFD
jgi:hypothetical protein